MTSWITKACVTQVIFCQVLYLEKHANWSTIGNLNYTGVILTLGVLQNPYCQQKVEKCLLADLYALAVEGAIPCAVNCQTDMSNEGVSNLARKEVVGPLALPDQ